jgi:hypothetical protein
VAFLNVSPLTVRASAVMIAPPGIAPEFELVCVTEKTPLDAPT